MFRFFIELAYDGTNYCGWQRQPKVITVQEVLEDLISKIYKEKITVMGCGRTDTGVHASQYFAHINVSEKKDYLLKALEGQLPKDIIIKRILEVEPAQHARFDAIERTYLYKLHSEPNPFKRTQSLHVDLKKLDNNLIQRACKLFTTYENYEQLSKLNPKIKVHNSLVRVADWKNINNEKVEFTVTSNRFLHNQIRRMVGCLLDIGVGKIDLEDLENAMKNNLPLPYNTKVAPHGLYLHKIKYPFLENY